jgi:hypothetical protein
MAIVHVDCYQFFCTRKRDLLHQQQQQLLQQEDSIAKSTNHHHVNGNDAVHGIQAASESNQSPAGVNVTDASGVQSPDHGKNTDRKHRGGNDVNQQISLNKSIEDHLDNLGKPV